MDDELDLVLVDPEEVDPEAADHPAVQEIEPKLLALFEQQPDRVFYETQLSIRFEKEFFHWVTARALRVLAANEQIGTTLEKLGNATTIRFYFHKRNRYWKRKAAAIRKLVRVFSNPTFARTLGHQGESLVDAGLPRAGFMPAAVNVQAWGDKRWTGTNHDLDRVFIRDGIPYGWRSKTKPATSIERNSRSSWPCVSISA